MELGLAKVGWGKCKEGMGLENPLGSLNPLEDKEPLSENKNKNKKALEMAASGDVWFFF